MRRPAKSSYSQIGDVTRQIQRSIQKLMLSLQNSMNPRDSLERIRENLESLPLATEEFDLAKSRIRNARRYLDSGETGAARYEVRMLIRGLNEHLDAIDPPEVLVLDDDHSDSQIQMAI